MVRIDTNAIVCGLAMHGEHGAVVRMLSPGDGLIAAYVRGARGRRMRPVLIPGNMVAAQLRSRTEAQLPQATIELIHSRAPILAEPLPAAAIEWVTSLAAAVLPERHPYPRLFEALSGLLDAIEAAPSASGWGAALVRFELLLLAELGFGLERDANRRPSLPSSFTAGRAVTVAEVIAGFDLSGHFLLRDVIGERSGAALRSTRSRLVDRFRRIAC